MAIVLVTGFSGSGTSTVLAELARRGHQVLDTDYGGRTHEARSADGSVDHRWDEDRMAACSLRMAWVPLRARLRVRSGSLLRPL